MSLIWTNKSLKSMFLSILNDSLVPTIEEQSTYIKVVGQLLIFEKKKDDISLDKKKMKKKRQNKPKN